MSSASIVSPHVRQKRAACEVCRLRKIKCCGGEPCTACSKQLLRCVYKEPEERRRPHASRIAKIRRQQSSQAHSITSLTSASDEENLDQRPPQPSHLAQLSLPSEVHNQPTWVPQTSNFSWADQTPQSAVAPVIQGWSLSNADSKQTADVQAALWRPSSERSVQTSSDDVSNIPQSLTTMTSFSPEYLTQDPNYTLPSFANGSISRRPQHPQSTNGWPAEVDDAILLPWLDCYFKRLNPIIPVLSHISVYEAMLLGRHRIDRDFGAMILSICSIIMVQCVYTEEADHLDERTNTARTLMQHSARMRSTWDFGQDPTIETVLTSFFLFGCLFSDGQQRAAWHQLRLAVDMACQIGLDQPHVYPASDKRDREQRIRIYLTLAVTERACALMRRHTISLRGRPWSISLSAQQTSMIFDDPAFDFDEGQSRREIAGLLCLAHLFDGIDEGVIDCWNGRCRKTDGLCDTTDRREILALTRRIMTVAYRVLPTDSLSTRVIGSLNSAQKADILITQLWILNRIWHLSMSHGLLQGASEHPVLTPEFAVAISCAVALVCAQLEPQSIEVHGIGMLEKLSDITVSVQTAKDLVGDTRVAVYAADRSLFIQALESCEDFWQRCGIDTSQSYGSIEEVLAVLTRLLSNMRDGRHPYTQAGTTGWQA